MVECEVHSQDLNEDVDLIDFSEPDEEIQEEIDIEVKQSGSPFYNHLLTPIFSSKHCSHNKMQI
jgi:hypothetical protein